MTFFKILAVGGFVSGWIGRSLPDRALTIEEIAELVRGILEILDLPVRIEIPSDLAAVTQALQGLPGVEVQR